MNTFLPYSSFRLSAQCLDNARLFKQIVECKQMLLGQFLNHPCSKMWVGYRPAMMQYSREMLYEVIRRKRWPKLAVSNFDLFFEDAGPWVTPPWIGLRKLHSSHRSNLIRKDQAWYGSYGWAEGPDQPYYWPE
jgi:hypothetical protein